MEHCRECHQTFAATRPGDDHRTGKHELRTGPDRRRCRTTDEMLAVGLWRDARGVWHGRASASGVSQRWDGADVWTRAVQDSAEPGALPMDPAAEVGAVANTQNEGNDGDEAA